MDNIQKLYEHYETLSNAKENIADVYYLAID